MNSPFWLIAIYFILLSSVNAGGGLITTKTMEFDKHRSINEGCLLVEREMKKTSVQQHCGSDFQAASLRIKSEKNDSLSRIYLEMASGYITSFTKTHTTIDTSQDSTKFKCTIRAEIKVSCLEGSRDPDHQPVTAQLNKNIFIQGDELVINIDPAPHDRFVSIVQIITRANLKEEVWRVFPNKYNSRQLILANQKTVFPNGYQLITQLIDDSELSEESLMLITTKSQPANLADKSTLEEFYFWLSEIELSNRRELILPYKVIKRGNKI